MGSNEQMMPVPCFPGYYASRDGEIWSDRRPPKGLPMRRLKPFVDKLGYKKITLYPGGKKTTYLVHRLIALAFLGPPPDGMQCLHGNGDSLDCRIENLRYGTCTENHADRRRHGTLPMGDTSGSSKLTSSHVLEMRARVAAGEKRGAMAAHYGVSLSCVDSIVTRITWKHLSPVEDK